MQVTSHPFEIECFIVKSVKEMKERVLEGLLVRSRDNLDRVEENKALHRLIQMDDAHWNYHLNAHNEWAANLLGNPNSDYYRT